MNGGYKEIVQKTGNYQEILNTVVGSKVYYMFQEEVYKALQDPYNIELGNKIALDEALQYLWANYSKGNRNDKHLAKTSFYVLAKVTNRLEDEGIERPDMIEADTFEEFLDELKEMKLGKTKV